MLHRTLLMTPTKQKITNHLGFKWTVPLLMYVNKAPHSSIYVTNVTFAPTQTTQHIITGSIGHATSSQGTSDGKAVISSCRNTDQIDQAWQRTLNSQTVQFIDHDLALALSMLRTTVNNQLVCGWNYETFKPDTNVKTLLIAPSVVKFIDSCAPHIKNQFEMLKYKLQHHISSSQLISINCLSGKYCVENVILFHFDGHVAFIRHVPNKAFRIQYIFTSDQIALYRLEKYIGQDVIDVNKCGLPL